MIWFTSDTHFGHLGIISHANRPFSSVEEMDEALIYNINSVVKPNDQLFHLGDFAWKNHAAYRARINCKNITLVIGNHDPHMANGRPKAEFAKLFTDVFQLMQMNLPLPPPVGSVPVTLCHYAMDVWDRSHYGAFMLHGHSHGTLLPDHTKRRIDVGVDAYGGLMPMHAEQIAAIMTTKTFKPVDHHGDDHE